MSRLGKLPLKIPPHTEASFERGIFSVKGPKGALARPFTDDVAVTVADGSVT